MTDPSAEPQVLKFSYFVSWKYCNKVRGMRQRGNIIHGHDIRKKIQRSITSHKIYIDRLAICYQKYSRYLQQKLCFETCLGENIKKDTSKMKIEAVLTDIPIPKGKGKYLIFSSERWLSKDTKVSIFAWVFYPNVRVILIKSRRRSSYLWLTQINTFSLYKRYILLKLTNFDKMVLNEPYCDSGPRFMVSLTILREILWKLAFKSSKKASSVWWILFIVHLKQKGKTKQAYISSQRSKV